MAPLILRRRLIAACLTVVVSFSQAAIAQRITRLELERFVASNKWQVSLVKDPELFPTPSRRVLAAAAEDPDPAVVTRRLESDFGLSAAAAEELITAILADDAAGEFSILTSQQCR